MKQSDIFFSSKRRETCSYAIRQALIVPERRRTSMNKKLSMILNIISNVIKIMRFIIVLIRLFDLLG